MSLLITGSEGYIGQHLIKMLGNNNFLALDLKIGLDIRQPITFKTKFSNVIHLAALVNVSKSTKYPEDYFITNVMGTINLLKYLEYDHFIFASTGSVVGLASPYALSKKMAEVLVEDYCKKNNKQYTILRFHNVIGTGGVNPTNPDSLFSSLMKAEETGTFYIYGDDYNTKDGTCLRDYTHVNEICHAIIKTIDNPSNSIENLGHGVGISVKEMIEIYKKVNNCSFDVVVKPRRPGDMETSISSKASKYMRRMYQIEEVLKKD